MKKSQIVLSAVLAVAGTLAALPHGPAAAQGRIVQPERKLLNVSLGRQFLDILRRFGQPTEVQTVALSAAGEQLPGVGGGAGGEAGMPGMPGMGGMMGGYPGVGGGMGPGGPMGMGAGPAGYPGLGGMGAGSSPGAPFGGGGPFGGAGASAGVGAGAGGPLPPPPGFGGAGSSPGAPGGMPGMGGYPGMPGMGGEGGAGMAGGPAMPEYSNAILWVYKRKDDARIEFLINEDGRVAQISLAAPATTAARVGASLPGSKTSKGITLGSNLTRVMDAYGYPERHRMLPGLRFYEVYYSKNYHAAFTFDTQRNMRCVRVTIALAD